MAFAINSSNKSFTPEDHEIIHKMSTACLRKLNWERDQDMKKKLIGT